MKIFITLLLILNTADACAGSSQSTVKATNKDEASTSRSLVSRVTVGEVEEEQRKTPQGYNTNNPTTPSYTDCTQSNVHYTQSNVHYTQSNVQNMVSFIAEKKQLTQNTLDGKQQNDSIECNLNCFFSKSQQKDRQAK